MNIWIIKLGEPLPIDPGSPRLFRSGLLASELSARGHKVTYWTSNVIHHMKILRDPESLKNSPQGWEILPLQGCLYKKNVSLNRIRHNAQTARDFEKRARSLPKPDIILSCLPTLELCQAATIFSIENNIPCIIDIRDLWPDIIRDHAPQALRPLARGLLAGMFRQVKQACVNATAITGVSEPIVQWGLDYSQRPANSFDRAFYLSYDSKKEKTPSNQNEILAKLKISKSDFLVVYFGALSKRHEWQTILEAIKALRDSKYIKFLICGKGDSEEEILNRTKNLNNVITPGWLNAEELSILAQRADLGLIPFASSSDYIRSYPNKVGEYLHYGIPIVSSINGILKEFLAENQCGTTYSNNSPTELIELLVHLSNSPEEVKNMRQHGKTAFEKNFDAKKTYLEMSKWLEGIAANVNTTASNK